MTRRKCALALSLGLLLVGDAPLASAAPMFSGLGDLSSGGFSSLASAISGDVGWGVNPDRFSEAWIALIPEPATGALFSLGLAAIGAARRVRRGPPLRSR